MKKTARKYRGVVFYFAAGCVAMCSPATAGLLYDNGPVNGQYAAFDISDDGSGSAVTDSFILGADALVTGIDFAAWTGGSGVSSINWAITTSPFGSGNSILGSGTATATSILNEPLTNANQAFNIYQASFDTGGVSLTAGITYWLQLSGAEQADVAPGGAVVYWDENDGPSQAFSNLIGPLANYTCGTACGQTGSETFQLVGTPEPGTVTTLLSGLLLLGAFTFYKTGLYKTASTKPAATKPGAPPAPCF